MFEILTAEQSKLADKLAMDGGLAGIQLMGSAGLAVARRIIEKYQPGPVLVLCGPGNNGGDGFVIARNLMKEGWPVRLACLVKKNTLKGDAALAAKEWEGEVESLNSNLALKDAGLVIDAVFGTGFSGQLAPEIITLFDKIRAKKIPVAAVDIPSGIDATTGAVAEGTLQAAFTVTFTRKKPAHMLLPAKQFCGSIFLSHIGISDETVASLNTALFENHPALWVKDFPLPDTGTHKYDRGHTVVLGGRHRTGAACLAAAAAQRAGSGLTTLAAPASAAAIYSGYRASLMVDAWDNLEDLKAILRDERRNAFVLGPGLGTDAAAKEVLDAALSYNRPGVLDADVFTLYKSAPKDLFSKLSTRHVLTPHEGEFARLFPEISGDKLARARAAAKISGAIILLKGADTVIAAPDGTALISGGAPATLATGGSGDVLAGLIAGLIAQGMRPFMAAGAACWLHGQAAKIHGLGLTPEDIIHNISQTLNTLFGLPAGTP